MGEVKEMDTMTHAPEAAKILGGKGKKLHAHEMHIRHADNGGYIARHELRDKNGNPPADGQKSSIETQHPDMAALQAMIQEHMQQNAQGQPGAAEPDDDEA
jgi:hypothetical protein